MGEEVMSNQMSFNPFVDPAIMVSVEDAIAYAESIFAGVDNLLIELRDDLLNELTHGLTVAQRNRIGAVIDAHFEAARDAVDEHACN